MKKHERIYRSVLWGGCVKMHAIRELSPYLHARSKKDTESSHKQQSQYRHKPSFVRLKIWSFVVQMLRITTTTIGATAILFICSTNNFFLSRNSQFVQLVQRIFNSLSNYATHRADDRSRSLNHFLLRNEMWKFGGRWVAPIVPTRLGKASVSGSSNSNFCSSEVKNRNNSIFARDSPTHDLLPESNKVCSTKFEVYIALMLPDTCPETFTGPVFWQFQFSPILFAQSILKLKFPSSFLWGSPRDHFCPHGCWILWSGGQNLPMEKGMSSSLLTTFPSSDKWRSGLNA